MLLRPRKLSCRLVTDYRERASSPTGGERVDSHLPGCAHCSRYLDQMIVTVALVGRLPAPPAEPQSRSQLIALYRRAGGRRSGRRTYLLARVARRVG